MTRHSKWLKQQIKALEKIPDRTIGQEYDLYNLYCTEDHIPFGETEYSEKTLKQWTLIKNNVPKIIKYLHKDDLSQCLNSISDIYYI